MKKNYLKTIKFQVIFIVVIAVIFIHNISNYFYNSISEMLYQQRTENYTNLMQLYRMQFDEQLKQTAITFDNMLLDSEKVLELLVQGEENHYTLTKISLSRYLKDVARACGIVDFIYVYDVRKDIFVTGAAQTSQYYNANDAENDILNSYRSLEDERIAYTWHIDEFNGTKYLTKAYLTDTYQIGVCVNMDVLLPSKGDMYSTQDNVFLVMDHEGHLIAQTGEDSLVQFIRPDLNKGTCYLEELAENEYAIFCYSEYGKYWVVQRDSEIKALSQLSKIIKSQKYTNIGAVFLLLIVMMLLMNKVIFKPIKELINTMKKVEQGNLDIRITKHAKTTDFYIVYETFNNMLDQITNLKLNVYKEKVLRTEAELQELKMQLSPHFLLNSLNIVYVLIRRKQDEIAMEYIKCLVVHFRYIIDNKNTMALLSREMEFVENYLKIYHLQHSNMMEYEIQNDINEDVSIPPLMIENFVENSLKYSMRPDRCMIIQIKINWVEENGKRLIHCYIQDNGYGFEEKLLEELQNQNYREIKQTSIGIYNVWRRLDIIYHGNAKLIFGNKKDGGAFVDIYIPDIDGFEFPNER